MRLALILALATVLPAPSGAAKLDLNAVRAADLEALPGIGRVTAERIVHIRERNGPYRCVEELRAVPRLTEAQFQALSSRVDVPSADPRCEQQEAARRAGKRVEAPRLR